MPNPNPTAQPTPPKGVTPAGDQAGAQRSPYNYRWQRYREVFLQRNPLCVFCQQQGRIVPATVVDHIVPHKGSTVLFWAKDNHQALCKPCHDSVKQAAEAGKIKGCGADGMPIGNPNHHWAVAPTAPTKP